MDPCMYSKNEQNSPSNIVDTIDKNSIEQHLNFWKNKKESYENTLKNGTKHKQSIEILIEKINNKITKILEESS